MEFSHNKIGLAGLGMLIFFLAVGIFSDVIAPYSIKDLSAESPWQADRYALPDWVTIFPAFQDLPPQQKHKTDWTHSHSGYIGTVKQDLPDSVNYTKTAGMLTVYYNASKSGSHDPVTVYFNASFNYPYAPMQRFLLRFTWSASPDQVVQTLIDTPWGLKPWGPATGSMEYMIKIDLIIPNGTSYPIWDQNWWKYKEAFVRIPPPAFWNTNSTAPIDLWSTFGELAEKLGFKYTDVYLVPAVLFSTKGPYTLQLGITMRPGTMDGAEVPLENATGRVSVSCGDFIVWGRRFGLLGTDYYAHDVFSQLVHGSKISIIIGVTAAATATLLGLLVGVTAGYLGGWTDETLMRMVDVLICLPILPVLLVFVAIFGYNVYYLIIIIAIFGWQGLSRVIRSQALSLREMAFVESAIASGARRSYTIWRHIVPNVLPTALTAMVLAVPGAIILEAAVSFIGMGDPYAPTWGKILYHAQDTGAFTPAILGWWVVIPPGLAITFLCLAFVFIGHAIDEVVNPRLRRRR